MALTIPGFEYQRVNVDDHIELNVAIGGSGRPIVLLHGFPQTHLMWRHVAVELATSHTVVCPDLRGYGDSDKPAATDPTIYSKRRTPCPRSWPITAHPPESTSSTTLPTARAQDI